MDNAAAVYVMSYITAIGLILIGLVGMTLCRHAIRIILSLLLLETGVNLLLIAIGYQSGASAPLLQNGVAPELMVDPLPQALVLTAIVIGLGVQALALGLAVRAYQAYGTLDTRELARKIAEESGTRLIDNIPVTQMPADPLPKLEEKGS